jgi:hypothetical protein
MTYRISGLSPAAFAPLYGLLDAELAARGVERVRVSEPFSAPDRVALRDVEPGETVLLLNHVHQPAPTPYRSAHAIFVAEGATEQAVVVGHIPDVLRRRPISLRAFDAGHAMIDADLVEGAVLEGLIARFLAKPRVAYLHAHYARRGCYAALVERA